MFHQKNILITGASSGIGKACAEIFAKNGANLILSSRNLTAIKELSEMLKSKYSIQVFSSALDVRNKNEIETFFQKLPSQWKKIDVLINNAGLALGLEKLHLGNTEDWDTMIDTNIKGLLYVTKKVVPLMIEQKLDGHVINIGSLAGIAAYPAGAVYCATKAAVRFISDGLRMDVVDQPIRVTNIQPGMVETNFSITRFHGDQEKAKKFYEGITTLTAEDIAETVFFAASRPKHVQICEITVTPTQQASSGIVYRKY